MDQPSRQSLQQNGNQSVPGSRDNVPGSQAQQQDQQQQAQQQQQATQQQMNSQAQRQAATPPNQRTTVIGGKEVPFFPAPQGHATSNLYRLNARARQQEKNQENPGVPASATPDALASARIVSMPAGGIHALASTLYPEDTEDNAAMDQHLQDILNLNRDTIRDDTSFTVGSLVRVPA